MTRNCTIYFETTGDEYSMSRDFTPATAKSISGCISSMLKDIEKAHPNAIVKSIYFKTVEK